MIYTNMKKYIFTLILLSCSQVALADNSCDDLSLKEKVSEIRENYADINNNLKRYKMLVDNNLEGSSEGAKANYYIDNQGDMVKRVEIYYGETGKSLIEYYYYQGDLRFIFTLNTDYNSHISLPDFDPTKSIITANRYYFYCDRMIKWLDKDKNSISPDSDEFIEKENELFSNVQRGHAIYESEVQVRRIFL